MSDDHDLKVLFDTSDPLDSSKLSDEEFFEEFGGVFANSKVDHLLENHFGERSWREVQALTKSAPKDEWTSGRRVAFVTNLDSVLTYDNFPDPGTAGTVVKVRTGAGDTTNLDGRVFVLWDDGKLRPILAKHLKGSPSKVANNVRVVVANLGDISSFFSPTTATDELVHKATKDLWALKSDGDNFVLERLFQEDGNPLKV
jgi:hypothetical protein